MDNSRREIKTVCVYGASSKKIRPIFGEAAHRLGILLGERGINVINGAGDTGLMRKVSDGAMEAGANVTGIIPRFMVENDWAHKGIPDLIEVETMHERKEKMAAMSDAVIALPGGCGTMEELLEMITWRQLGLYKNPVIILDTDHYYEPLLQMFRQSIEEQFMRPEDVDLWKVADTPEEAVELLFT